MEAPGRGARFNFTLDDPDDLWNQLKDNVTVVEPLFDIPTALASSRSPTRTATSWVSCGTADHCDMTLRRRDELERSATPGDARPCGPGSWRASRSARRTKLSASSGVSSPPRAARKRRFPARKSTGYVSEPIWLNHAGRPCRICPSDALPVWSRCGLEAVVLGGNTSLWPTVGSRLMRYGQSHPSGASGSLNVAPTAHLGPPFDDPRRARPT
jgi:hypothetical protein